MTPIRPAKLFTPEQATAMLPLLRVIAADMVEVSRDVADRQQRLGLLTSGRELEEGDPYGDELSQAQLLVERDEQRVLGYVEELTELGVQVCDLKTGVLGFPCEMDGQLALLCWRIGEPEVAHWREMDADFADREPLPAAVDDA